MYIVVCDGDVILATDDNEIAERSRDKICADNEDYVRDTYDLDEETSAGEISFMAGYDGDNAEIFEIFPDDFDTNKTCHVDGENIPLVSILSVYDGDCGEFEDEVEESINERREEGEEDEEEYGEYGDG